VCQYSKSPTMKQAPLHFSRYLAQRKKKSSCLYSSGFSVPHSIPHCYQTEHQLAVRYRVPAGSYKWWLYHASTTPYSSSCYSSCMLDDLYCFMEVQKSASNTCCSSHILQKSYFFTIIQN